MVLFQFLAVASMVASSTLAFAPTGPIAFHSSSFSTFQQPKNTVVYVSSWGTDGPPHKWADTLERENPADKVQAYLTDPAAVEARNTIDGKCMVSGLVNAKDRTDQFIFDLLNHEESAFEFEKLVAFVDDAKFAKKRLLSRSARYTGLLDKLEFVDATTAGALPTKEQLDGIKSWVAAVEATGDNDVLETIKSIGALAKDAPTVENVAIVVSNAIGLDVTKSQAALDSLKDNSFAYTLVVVGKLEDRPEGKEAYKFDEFGTEDAVLGEKAVFSREESYRMITELLQLESGVNQAVTVSEVYNVNRTEAKLVKGLREAGYVRMQEIDHMINDGPKKYAKAIEEWKEKNPDAAAGYSTTDAWWESEAFQKQIKRRIDQPSKSEQEAAALMKDARTQEVEKIAKEWAKREYFRKSMSGSIPEDQSEEEFIKSVWDRAMFEGDLKYRQAKGEITDDENELADFKKQQELKQQTMLKRAKEELAEMLEEEDLGGDDISKALNTDDDDKKKN